MAPHGRGVAYPETASDPKWPFTLCGCCDLPDFCKTVQDVIEAKTRKRQVLTLSGNTLCEL
eukprot:2903595-Amphidinium_carterae.1